MNEAKSGPRWARLSSRGWAAGGWAGLSAVVLVAVTAVLGSNISPCPRRAHTIGNVQRRSTTCDALEALWGRAKAAPALTLFLFALTVRLLWTAALLSAAPEIIAFPSVDGAFYHQWAQDVLTGTGLAKEPFFAHPLYPYVMAVLYAAFGPQPLAVVVFQCVLGALSSVLMVRVCASFFEPEAAWVAGAGLAILWPAVANAALLETVELGNVLLLLALVWQIRPKARWGFLAGISLAAAGLCRANLLILAPAFLLATRDLKPSRLRLLHALAFALGIGVVFSAVGLRNRITAGQWLFSSGHAGVTFYSGFAPGNFTGTYQAPTFVRPEPRYEQVDFHAEAERRSHHPLSVAEASRYWRNQAMASITADPSGAALRVLRKLRLLIGAYEVADNNNLSYLRSLTWFRYAPLPGWGLLVAFGTMGMLACWRRRQPLAWLYASTGAYTFSLMLFFVSSRLRAPLWLMLMPFAAVGLIRLWTWVRAGQWANLVAEAGPVLALAIALQFVVPNGLRQGDHAQALGNHAHALMQSGALVQAEGKQQAALEMDPQNPYLLVNAGQLSLRLEQPAKARTYCTEAMVRNPRLATAHACRGVSRAQLGDERGALFDLRRAVALDPAAVPARLNLAIVLGRSGDVVAARSIVDQLARDAPTDATVQAAARALKIRP